MLFKRFFSITIAALIIFIVYGCTDTKTKDAEITQQIQNLIVQNKDLSQNTSVTIETNKGVVTLSGNVPSRKDEEVITQVANSVKGVKKVESKLTIQSTEASNNNLNAQSDNAMLVNAVKIKLGSDLNIPSGIIVDNVDGVITLTGTIKNKNQEFYIIKLIENVEGVKRVESRLVLDQTVPTMNMQSSTTTAKSRDPDDKITEEAKYKIASDPSLATETIAIITKDGVVTMSGTVDDPSKVTTANNIVSGISGVKKVISNIQVKSTTVRSTELQTTTNPIGETPRSNTMQSDTGISTSGGRPSPDMGSTGISETGQLPSASTPKNSTTQPGVNGTTPPGTTQSK